MQPPAIKERGTTMRFRFLLGAATTLLTLPLATEVALAQSQTAAASTDRAILTDTATLAKFGLTPEKVQFDLATRTPEQANAYIAALNAAVADVRYKPGVDMAEIPLNPQAPGYNASTLLRPKMLDQRQRADGVFSLKRYLTQKGGGIPTFADAPVAVRMEDLVASRIQVAFVSAPLDLSSGWRDAKHAPEAMRAMDGLVGADADGGIDPALALRLADYGNLSVDNMSPERTVGHIRETMAAMAKNGVIPFMVGGDHTLMYPDVAGLSDTYGAGNLSLVQFDAHPEAMADGDHTISDNQTLTRLLDQKLINPRNVTQVGVRGRDYDVPTAARLKSAGVVVHGASAIEDRGWKAVAGDVVKRLKRGPSKVFVSFDMSVLDPGLQSGAGRPAPGGLTTREAIPMVREICRQTDVVGFELLDTAPVLDTSYVSLMNGNYILHACLSGIALRKTGNRS